ncbi:MAG: ABC transporter permease [Bacteroidetes bacterium GWF2_42_66]|nr:MAG: ABC transporter permease [Bacteroidetes bacterium GWA2_42_15]OFX98968.1 MAG: ABC transporter permease [Bacteroidetes bacterium GWE2_42_39]OFY46037.1 MAG: ABC transporter permease [Bacteroidetes bacterium GWF2_42_66]HBL77201.1 ABC transporter permease [Prolixibacteraceae bacterium]HCR90048.1 ABC transporter permease [Prolixibacteraceae bacterium]
MKQIGIITKRELQAIFDSLMAYITIIVFLGLSGFFTWLYGGDVFFVGQASMQSFFGIAYWTFFFFIPALTMKLIAEEKKTGTLEILLTKPVTDWQIIWGKFLATLLLIIIALALTLPYYITIWNIGPIDHGAVWTGYLGLILMSSAYISIGIFTSSITNNQIVAFLLALCIGIFFHIIFGILAASISGVPGSIFNYLSLSTHYESISRGVVDSKDIIYFLSIIFLGLIGSEAVLAKRNIN